LKFSIAILAGGTSKRMGTDKALLPFESSTFLQHIKTICKEQTDQLMICSSDERHKLPKTKLITDLTNNIGPLGGLIPAMDHSKYDWTIVVSCDMPFINPSFFEEITKQISKLEGKSIIPVSNGKPQYLCAAYHKSILKLWKAQLASNNFSVRHNLTNANCSFVEMDHLEKETFKNINNLDEYQSILK
jgi:molybdopterin-guanine dinucleotide biosynthesis protein A